MYLRTLGGVALEGVDFTRPKPLLLLSYLALEGPQHRRSLAELFWPGTVDHMKNLTVTLSRIRKAAPDLVEADGERAWTEVELDAERFLERVEQGDAEGATALYRGPFLDGFYLRNWGAELEEWVVETRDFLARHACRAWLDLAEREAGRAGFGPAAHHAERAYELAGAAVELPDLDRIHTLLLAGDSLKAVDVRAEAEGFGLGLASSSNEARERLITALNVPAHQPAHNLPAPRATAFMGRDRELEDIARSLTRPDVRLLSLLGTAGIGKSRLALEAGREQVRLNGFRDGVYRVCLESLTSPGGIPDAVADALGLEPQPSADTLEQVVAHLRDRETLLIFDNFEHLTAGATVLSDLIRGCAGLTLLVTSRERLNLEEEHIFPVAGLAVPEGDVVTPDAARRFGAVRLFAHRAKRADPTFELTRANLPSVLRICRLLEGLPLGLELAAAWVRVVPCRELVQELEENLDLPSTPTRGVPERHRSLRSAFEHSWKLLSTRDREVLRRLAVFRGGFRRGAAGAVAGATLPVLASLVDKSLLRVSRPGRYDQHPVIQAYTRSEAAAGAPDHEAATRRHSTYFMDFLDERSGAFRRSDGSSRLQEIEAEFENVAAAWRWAVEQNREDMLVRAVSGLGWFAIVRGRQEQVATMLEHALTRAGEGSLLRARALGFLGVLQSRMGRASDGVERIREGLAILERHAAPGDRATLLRFLGVLHSGARAPDRAKAAAAFREALDLFRELEDAEGVAMMLNNLAEVADAEEASARFFEESIRVSREAREPHALGMALDGYGRMLFCQNRLEEATKALQECLSCQQETGNLVYLASSLQVYADVLLARDDPEAARAKCHEILERPGHTGKPGFEARVHCVLGRIAILGPDPAQAHRHLWNALEKAWASGRLPIVRDVLLSLGELHRPGGSPEQAAQVLEAAQPGSRTSSATKRRVRDLARDLRRHLSASGPRAVESATQARGMELLLRLGE